MNRRRAVGPDAVRRVDWLVAGDPAQVTGGYLYDARISDALCAAGVDVRVAGLAGRFPMPDARARQALDRALASCAKGGTVVLDGLVLGGCPEVVAVHAARLRLVALIHHPLALEWGLDEDRKRYFRVSERQALASVAHIVTSSAYTAQCLVHGYGVAAQRLDVVEPGLDPPATGAVVCGRGLASSGPELAVHDSELAVCESVGREAVKRLLCVATLIPRKGHLVLVAALSQLADLAWSCDFVGDARRDPQYAQAVQAAIRTAGLAHRIRVCGVLDMARLSQAYRRASLFVLPSFFEGYGMVIAEALAYGLPIVTTSGGALVRTLPAGAGLVVPPGDPVALADALGRLLRDDTLCRQLSARALAAARGLAGWDVAARRFADVLRRVQAPCARVS